MLIANTTDQKFLEAIFDEQQKTNELLSQLLLALRPIAKDTEPKVKQKGVRSVKKRDTVPKTDKSKRGIKNGNNNN